MLWNMRHSNKVMDGDGMSINALPPFQYSLDCFHLNMTTVEKIRVIRTDIINLENKITWISPIIAISRRWPTKDTSYTHWRMDSSSGHLIWTYIYPMRYVV